MKKYIDLSHTIEDGLITYKGLPAPIICDYLSREDSKSIYGEGAEFQIGKIEMVSNTGTYIDCPFHRYADGKDLTEIALEALIDLDAVLIKIHHSKKLNITKEDLVGFDLKTKRYFSAQVGQNIGIRINTLSIIHFSRKMPLNI